MVFDEGLPGQGRGRSQVYGHIEVEERGAAFVQDFLVEVFGARDVVSMIV